MDVEVSNHGSIVLVRPLTKAAQDWLDENVNDARWLGYSMACEPRFVDALLEGMREDGLEVA